MGFVDKYHNKYQTGGLQHLLAKQIRMEVGNATFNAYLKFSIVRNPWDRTVSQFAYMQEREDLRDYLGMRHNDPFHRYLELIEKKPHVQWEPQIHFLKDDAGRLLVDHIGRFERLETDANAIFRRIGLAAVVLPHENRGMRGPYSDYYDRETRERVAALYADDIHAFGYSYSLNTEART